VKSEEKMTLKLGNIEDINWMVMFYVGTENDQKSLIYFSNHTRKRALKFFYTNYKNNKKSRTLFFIYNAYKQYFDN
jgi:hypothetical protein